MTDADTLKRLLLIFEDHGEAGLDLVSSDEKLLYQMITMKFYSSLHNTSNMVFDMLQYAYEQGAYEKTAIIRIIFKKMVENEGVIKFLNGFVEGEDLEEIGRPLFVETVEYHSLGDK